MQDYKMWIAISCILALLSIVQTLQFQEILDARKTLPAQPTERTAPKEPTTALTEEHNISGASSISVQNRNPLNIKDIGKYGPWEGQIGKDKHGHAIFSSWEYGVRAAALTLRSYAQQHGVDSISKIVSRFARGNQEAYMRFLEKELSVHRNDKLNILGSMPELLISMARFEGVILPRSIVAPYDIVPKVIAEGKL